VKPAASDAGPRYLEWMDQNRRKVAEATGGRIGYMHVPDTSFPGIIAFDKQFTAQLDKTASSLTSVTTPAAKFLTSIPRNSAANFLPRLHRARERRPLAARGDLRAKSNDRQ